MKRLLIILMVLMFSVSAHAVLDSDNNGAIDVASGGTNAVNSATALTNLGAATAAQGALANTAVQPADIGTAAALNAGTAIGNIPVLVDDGLGAASLPISALELPLLTNLTIGGAAINTLLQPINTYLTTIAALAPTNGYVITGNGTTWTSAAATGGVTNVVDHPDWPAGVTVTEVGYLDGVTSALQTQINNITGGYVATPWTYSDEACTAGTYSLSEAYRYDCIASGNINRTALTDWSNPTPVVPTLASAIISGADGLTLTLTGSESLSIGAGGGGGFDLDCTTAGAGVTATYASGAPGAALVYTLGTGITSTDTCNLDYIQPGNGVEATTGTLDLASIVDMATTNSSTLSGATITYYMGYPSDLEVSSLAIPTYTNTDSVLYDSIQLRKVAIPAGSTVQHVHARMNLNSNDANDTYGVIYEYISDTQIGSMLASGVMSTTGTNWPHTSATLSGTQTYFAAQTTIYFGVAVLNSANTSSFYYNLTPPTSNSHVYEDGANDGTTSPSSFANKNVSNSTIGAALVLEYIR